MDLNYKSKAVNLKEVRCFILYNMEKCVNIKYNAKLRRRKNLI